TLKVTLEILASFLGAPADDGAEVEPAWVAGDKCFRKEHKLCALMSSVACEIKNLLQRPLAIEGDRRGLHHGDAHGVMRVHNRQIRSRRIRNSFGPGHEERRTIQENGLSSQLRVASVKSNEVLRSLLLETLIVTKAGRLKTLCFQVFTEFHSTKAP